MDKFESLRAFDRVVACGGFAAAAREMGLSRSAVNKLVIQLEGHLGVQLLQRTTRKVTPTEVGLAFCDRARAILAELEAAELAVSRLHEEPRGTLKINAPMSFGILHLGPAVADFMGRYPDLQVQLTLNDRLIDPIEEGFDVTVRISRPPDYTTLIYEAIAPVDRLLCASPGYLERAGTPTHPRELPNYSCLHYGYLATGNQWKLIGPDGEHTIPIRGTLCSNNAQVLVETAVAGLGIILTPDFIAAKHLQRGTLRPILPDYRPPEIFLYVVYPPNRYLSAKIRLFADFLRDRFQRE